MKTFFTMDITLESLLLGPFYYFLFYKVRTMGNICQLSYKMPTNRVYNENCNQPVFVTSKCSGNAGLIGGHGNEFNKLKKKKRVFEGTPLPYKRKYKKYI